MGWRLFYPITRCSMAVVSSFVSRRFVANTHTFFLLPDMHIGTHMHQTNRCNGHVLATDTPTRAFRISPLLGQLVKTLILHRASHDGCVTTASLTLAVLPPVPAVVAMATDSVGASTSSVCFRAWPHGGLSMVANMLLILLLKEHHGTLTHTRLSAKSERERDLQNS